MGFDVFHLEDWSDVQALYRMYRSPESIENEAYKAVVTASPVIVIDSLSEVAELCWKQIFNVDRKALVSSRTRGKQDQPLGIYEDQATMEDWGIYGRRMMNLISAFCHLDRHVIMTALSAWAKDKASNETLRLPNLGGQAARNCLALFDEVFYMKSQNDSEGNNQRVWQTFDDGEVLAKDSSGVLSEYEPPDWVALFKKIDIKGSKE
jgi:hypothetical protein